MYVNWSDAQIQLLDKGTKCTSCIRHQQEVPANLFRTVPICHDTLQIKLFVKCSNILKAKLLFPERVKCIHLKSFNGMCHKNFHKAFKGEI